MFSQGGFWLWLHAAALFSLVALMVATVCLLGRTVYYLRCILYVSQGRHKPVEAREHPPIPPDSSNPSIEWL